MSTDPIAVTVIGGYLGSGKTTLVNHILSEAIERIAVVVNDFGDINIDAELIESQDDAVMSLANGCICCSLIDGFAATLDMITGLDNPPDRLVIEASGVSDPASVAAFGHGPGLALDAVVVLLDAETIRSRSDDRYVGHTVMQQMKAADVIVLNKSDLVPAADLEETLSWVSGICPEAFVTTAKQAVVAPEVLFGRPPKPRSQSTQDHVHDHDHGETLFETSTIEEDNPTTRARIETMMAEMPDSVVRAKGLIWLEDSPDKPGVLQRVGKRWTLRKRGSWKGAPKTQIVTIQVKREAP